MQIFKFNYTIKGTEKQYDVTIMSENKDKAISLIVRRIGSAIRVNSMAVVGPVHAIDEEIINKLSDSTDKVKKYKEKLSKLTKEYQECYKDLMATQSRLDEVNRQTQVSSKDIAQAIKAKTEIHKLYACLKDGCEYEGPSKHALKIHTSKVHGSDKVVSSIVNEAGKDEGEEGK